jgi:PAS domain S-box-containing protein
MSFEFTFYTNVLCLSGLLSVGAAYFSWQSRPEDGSVIFTATMLSYGGWAFGMVVALAASGTTVSWIGIVITFLSVAASTLCWLLFAIAYTGRRDWLTRPRLFALGAGYLGYAVALLTNPRHNLLFADLDLGADGAIVELERSFTLEHWTVLLVISLFVVFGSTLLYRQSFRSRNVYRKIGFLAGTGGMTLVAANTVDILGLVTMPTPTAAVLLNGFWATVSAATVYSVRVYNMLPIEKLLSKFSLGSETVVPLGRDFAIEYVDDGLIVLDRAGRIVDINSTIKEVFGRRIVGEPIFQIEALVEVLDGVTETSELGDIHNDVWINTPEEERFFSVTVTELQDGTSGIAGYAVLMQDITELKEREEELGLLTDTMSRFLRHNLRNEMNVVRGRMTMLEERVDPDDDESRQMVDQAIETMDKIVERSEKARYVEQIVENGEGVDRIDVGRKLGYLIETMQNEYPTVQFESDIESDVLAIGSRHIDTAIENLVENAIEHNDTDQKVVRIETSTSGDEVRVSISDNGPGISSQEIEVLERGTETDLQHGSGFGLWLVDWILERSNGDLTFDVDGSGTTVHVTLERATVTDGHS